VGRLEGMMVCVPKTSKIVASGFAGIVRGTHKYRT